MFRKFSSTASSLVRGNCTLCGRKVADRVLTELKTRVDFLRREGIQPRLVPVLIGDDLGSKVYIKHKTEKARQIGMEVQVEQLHHKTRFDELKELITALNHDDRVHGIIVQLPLPQHLPERLTCNLVIPEKDVDGFTSSSLGSLLQSFKADINEHFFVPCTALAVKHILNFYFPERELFSGKRAVVIGRSMNVGLPIALLLQGDSVKGGFDMTVTMCHRRTANLAEHTKDADVIVSAAGVPRLVTPQMVQPGSVVVDVGLSRQAVQGGRVRVVGDCHPDVKNVAGSVTPVPGGVGPCTVSSLLQNTVLSAERSLKMTRK